MKSIRLIAILFVFSIFTKTEIFANNCLTKTKEKMEYKVIVDSTEISCIEMGKGDITVVIISGICEPAEAWQQVQEKIAEFTRVISYNRPGYGNSPSVKRKITIESITEDLNKLLIEAKIRGPYILVGHCVGSFVARKFTEIYPEKVAGLVLMESFHDDFFKQLKDNTTDKQWYDYLNNYKIMENTAPEYIGAEIHAFLDVIINFKKYAIPSNIPVNMLTSVKKTEEEEKFKVLIEKARELHEKLNIEETSNSDNINHMVFSSIGHFFYREDPTLVWSSVLDVYRKIKRSK